jgi:hypothetical protein
MLEEIEDELMRSPVGEDMESVLIEKRELVKRLGYENIHISKLKSVLMFSFTQISRCYISSTTSLS